jgi:hypothetical protein
MPLFKDKNLQHQFERDGFVVTDLLNAKEVEELRAFYLERQAAHLSVEDKMHSTCDTGKLELILEVDQKLKAVILPKVDLLLESYDVLLGSYLVKEIGDGSETGFHQDPTLVDEQQYTSGNVWVALQDTDSQNGNLRVVKGSHRMIDTLIATPNCPVSYGSFRHRLLEFSTEVPVKAGQAIVLNHKMIHGATANHSNQERIAALIAIKSKAAKWRFLYLEPGNSNDQIEDYRLDAHSFATLIKNQRPTDAEFLGYISHDFPQLTEKEFVRFMQTGKRTVGLGARISSAIKTLFSN